MEALLSSWEVGVLVFTCAVYVGAKALSCFVYTIIDWNRTNDMDYDFEGTEE